MHYILNEIASWAQDYKQTNTKTLLPKTKQPDL